MTKLNGADNCRVLLVYPKFAGGSFWNYRDTCELIGARYPAPPLGLITVAAMLPQNWDLRLVDRNTEDLTDHDLEWADLVMTGGMMPQQPDSLDIIELCHRRGKPVAVGGPDATSSPTVYENADFRVLGEAEGVIDDFVAAWRSGDRKGTFESPKFQVDVTTSPTPRFDLLNFDNYVQVNVQFSRGCPFTCEFCDIIELYGRKPRTKNSEQMLAELDTLYRLGYRGHVDFVDDNLIGNKKAVKAFLPDIVNWQKGKGFPFEFSTEASLNLADDVALLKMMTDAAFFAVFVGIESPDPDVLVATRKKQNTRRDIAQSIATIYDAGMFVLAGFIVGFDEERPGTAEAIIDLIEEAAIPVCMVGLLYALPNTQLTRRLEKEGRLFPDHDLDDAMGDQCTTGLNFETKRPRTEVLADFLQVIETIYGAESYFERLHRVGSVLNMSGANGALHLSTLWRDIKQLSQLTWRLNTGRPGMRKHFWKAVFSCLRNNPRALRPVILMTALYAHLGPFSEFVSEQINSRIETGDLDDAAAAERSARAVAFGAAGGGR